MNSYIRMLFVISVPYTKSDIHNTIYPMNEECIFCKIIAGEIPAEKIYEDEHTFAFLDIKPTNPGHTLVIPKKHARNLLETSDEDLAHIITIVKKLSNAIKSAVRADGINVHFNNESAGGQVIFHTHAHIIPRFKEDGLEVWPQKSYSEGEAEKVKEKIKDELES